MVDPIVDYKCGRMTVKVEAHGTEHIVTACRARAGDFRIEAAVARCRGALQAQSFARMLVGVEMTRDGAAIWPDGRTEGAAIEPAEEQRGGERETSTELLRHLIAWADLMGGWEAPAWSTAREWVRQMTDYDEEPTTVERARAAFQDEGVLEIDDNALVSRADGNPDHGAYVQAWVWVPDEEETA